MTRSESALRLVCAFNGVRDWKNAPPSWWNAPNMSSQEAWARVMDEARQIVDEEEQQ